VLNENQLFLGGEGVSALLIILASTPLYPLVILTAGVRT
jgi:hypothetical protein